MVVREHNINGIPCKYYTTWTLDLTLTVTLTLTHYLYITSSRWWF